MEAKKIVVGLGLFLGSIIIAGLILNIFSLVKTWTLIILSLLIFSLFYLYFLNGFKKLSKHELILFLATSLISLFMAIIRRFPFSDFWWYHVKNWFIVNYLFGLGKIIGWVPYWHFGYPLLQMYGPGSHILVVFFAKIFQINQFPAEILINSIAYIMLVMAFYLFIGNHIGKTIGFFTALLVGISPRLFNEVFIQGHYPNMLALAFGLTGLSLLESKNKKEYVLFVLFIFLSLITHFSFFIILLLAMILTFILLKRIKDYKLLLKFFIPVLLAAFWLFPAISESRYWHGTVAGPSPFMIYLLSFGPSLLLILFGLYIMYKEKMGFLLAFTISLTLLSFLPALIFPILPEILRNILQKIFVDTFKSTITASIFLVIPIVIAINHIYKNMKLKKIGISLAILFIIFSLLLNYIYIRQDSVKVIKFNDEYYREIGLTAIYLNNYGEIKEVLSENHRIYNMDPIIAGIEFNASVASGPPIPAPKRILKFDKQDYLDYLKEKDVRVNLFTKKTDMQEYRLVNALGFFEHIEYEISVDYFKSIIADGKFIDYMLHPGKYPSSVEDRPVELRWTSEEGKFLDDGLKEEIIPIQVFGQNLDIGRKLTYELQGQKMSIQTKNKEDSRLKIGFNYSPHWKAYGEQRKLEVGENEDGTMTINVPGGIDRVELVWKLTLWDYIGIIISLLTLIIFIGLVFIVLA